MKIEQTVAIITGAASGLGQACARALIGNSAKVALFDLDDKAGELLQEELGSESRFYRVDVTSDNSVQHAIEQVLQDLGNIRICINCAGIAPGGKTVGRKGALALDKFASVVNVNLIGTFNVVRLAAQAMVENQPEGEDASRGVIINTASVAAFDGQMGQAAYAASKAGVAGMTLPIARDLGPQGIRVNAIAPGIFNTPMMQGMSEQVREPLEAIVQFPKRLGFPEEFAKLVVQIVENDYLNGETIRLDGGIRMPAL
jgi:3-hydroxyacyl-CoA dehydrogenase / 3-hydroxy-2-methylbutyryl-CoA dehydrogenase